MKTTLAFLAFASIILAQSDDPSSDLDPETPEEHFGDYIQEICFPYNQTDGTPLWDAPCNAAQNILIQCTYGPDVNYTDAGHWYQDNDSPPMLSNTTQQACICESQFWDQQEGCNLCFEKHGDTDFSGGVTDDVYTSMSSAYCAASTTPTLGFADWLEVAGESALSTISLPSETATSYSDPIGNKTAVSLYFTPSITGSAAWNVAVATTGASLHTVNGQIVATAGASGADVKVNPSASTSGNHATTTSGSYAAGTPQAMAAAAGVIGFAGLVALL